MSCSIFIKIALIRMTNLQILGHEVKREKKEGKDILQTLFVCYSPHFLSFSILWMCSITYLYSQWRSKEESERIQKYGQHSRVDSAHHHAFLSIHWWNAKAKGSLPKMQFPKSKLNKSWFPAFTKTQQIHVNCWSAY